jgi:UDP-glucose 4-epimerase
MRILVTGGAGYIGSKISYDLTDLGYNVFIIDNLSTGHKFLVNKKATFYHGDILDFKLLDKMDYEINEFLNLK